MYPPHPIAWLRSHPRAADALLTVMITVAAVVAHLSGDSAVNDPSQPDPAWWTLLLVLTATVPLYWRRSHPLRAGCTVVVADVAALFLGLGGAAFLGSVIAVYSIGAHTSGVLRTRVMSGLAALVGLLFIAGWIDGLSLLEAFIETSAVLVTAFVLGDNLRRRREHLDDLAERADRAEREQGLLAEQRVAAERTRIARDLHDVVAHSVSVMVIQAAAARRSLADAPDAAARALETIEATGRQTMTELRSILGVLRTDAPQLDAPPPPPPSLMHLEHVAGLDDLPVELVVDGDVAALPDSVSATGYRLVQEALTNVRRHAGPVGRVAVVLRITDRDVSIAVTDDGRGLGALRDGDGFGIVGMRERIAAVGGSFDAGPRPGGGWHVRATMPIDAGAGHRLAPGIAS